MTTANIRFTAIALLGLLSACAENRFSADVTRFHAAPPTRGAVFLIPAHDEVQSTLEYQNYAAAIATELREIGFEIAETRETATLIGKVDYGQTSREGLPGRSPVSVGIGGGTGGGGVGIGVGTSFGLGKKKTSEIVTNTLQLYLLNVADEKTVWEGRAAAETDGNSSKAALSAAIPVLADALLRDFPGPSGKTIRYKQ